MSSASEIALNECIQILKDKRWHDVYQFHQEYRLSALEIFQAVDTLLRERLIEKVGYNVRLIPVLTNRDLALLNKMQKTTRPAALDIYTQEPLTRLKKRV